MGFGRQAFCGTTAEHKSAGALYVLKGNSFLRISVGGVREESAQIEKSVALALLL